MASVVFYSLLKRTITKGFTKKIWSQSKDVIKSRRSFFQEKAVRFSK